MKCTIQLGFTSLNGTFHLSPHENICTIALINIYYLYTIIDFYQNKAQFGAEHQCGSRESILNQNVNVTIGRIEYL